jgi:drug/metabolite transporter (DMT)-like permease
VQARLWIALAATILFWSSSFAAIRIALDGYGPAELTCLRYAVASALLLALAVWRRLQWPQPSDLPLIVGLGLIGIAAYHLLISYGQQEISAGAAGVLSNTSPIFTALLAHAFMGERLRAAGWLGIGIAFAGAGMIAVASDQRLHVEPGAAFVLLAALAWSLYFIGQKHLLVRYRPLDLMTLVVGAGTLALLVFAPSAAAAARSASIAATVAAVYLGTGPTVVAYATWAYVLARTEASVAASALYAVPVGAMLLAWLVLGEVPSRLMISGAILALTGIVVVGSSRQHADRAVRA